MKEIDEDILKDLIAGKEEREKLEEEEKNEREETRPRRKRNDYASLYLREHSLKERRGIYISKENFERISVLTRLLCLPLSGYIDNVLTQHLEQFQIEISNTISEQISKLKP